MFTTCAYVYVRDPQKKASLVAWLENLGYDAGIGFSENRDFVSVNVQQGCIMLSTNPPAVDGIIKCNADISLFKALAAMNDARELGQWYICDTGQAPPVYAFARKGGGLEWIKAVGTFRRATARELCHYFNIMYYRRKNKNL